MIGVASTPESREYLEIEKYLYYPETEERRLYNVGFLKIMAVLLVIASVVGVFAAALYAPIPVVRISDVQGNVLMNYATFYVEGVVVEPPRVDYSGGKLRITLTVNDNSTPVSLPVYAYDPLASEMIKARKIPFIGDRVRLLVQLRVREDFAYAYLQDLRGIEILERPERGDGGVYVDSLEGVAEYSYVCVKGLVKSPRNVSAGLLFDVTTSRGAVTVLIPTIVNHVYGGDVAPVISTISAGGVPVDVCGVVYYYRGTSPEIVVRELEDISVGVIPAAETVGFGDLVFNTALYEGQTVKTQARFLGVYCEAFDDPCRLVFEDVEGQGITGDIMMPRTLMAAVIDPWTVGSGTVFNLTVNVVNSTYIVAYSADPVEVEPPIETSSVEEALSQERGRIIVLKNVSVLSSSVTRGGSWRIYVTDPSGFNILVFVPSTVAKSMGFDIPSQGSYISVAGYRHVYGRTDEIVVYTVNGVVVETAPPPPSPAFLEIDIKSVPGYVGRNVSFTGLFYAIRYDRGTYYVEVRSSDEEFAVNISMKWEQLTSFLDPALVGWKSLIRINGTVRSANLVEYVHGEVVQLRDPLKVTVQEALGLPLGRPLVVLNATVVSSRVLSNGSWEINITDSTGATIIVFIRSEIVGELGMASPPPSGAVVRVAGFRDVFRGKQEIEVVSKNGFTILG
jgi:DNA/RNA endonuclease YhcR with UshA esterase domain